MAADRKQLEERERANRELAAYLEEMRRRLESDGDELVRFRGSILDTTEHLETSKRFADDTARFLRGRRSAA